LLEPDGLADGWSLVEAELAAAQDRGELVGYHGCASVEDVAIGMATLIVMKRQRQNRAPRLSYEWRDLEARLLSDDQNLGQLALFPEKIKK
jgi:hypothetical protein